MDLTADLVAPCGAEDLFAWVGDLTTYPRWLGIVERVELQPGAEQAWSVDLRARIGPFSRSKRLRMVVVERDAPRRVVFERHEVDGRDHGVWRMTADVRPQGDSAHLTIHLHYDGRLWGPVLEPVLSEEIDRSRTRLQELVEAATGP